MGHLPRRRGCSDLRSRPFVRGLRRRPPRPFSRRKAVRGDRRGTEAPFETGAGGRRPHPPGQVDHRLQKSVDSRIRRRRRCDSLADDPGRSSSAAPPRRKAPTGNRPNLTVGLPAPTPPPSSASARRDGRRLWGTGASSSPPAPRPGRRPRATPSPARRPAGIRGIFRSSGRS